MDANATACGAGAPFDEGGMHSLKVVTIVSALFSMGGSAFIMLTWQLQRGTRRSLGMHVIFCLSVADLLSSLVSIVDGLSPTGVLEAERCGSTPEEVMASLPGLCLVLASLSQFTGLAAILWTACIAVGLHLGVLRRSKLVTQESDRLRCYMHAWVWGTAAFSLIVMASVPRTLGPTGQWCWIRQEAMVWAGGLFFYCPLVIVFAYSMTIYARTKHTLLTLHREASTVASLGSVVGGGRDGSGLERTDMRSTTRSTGGATSPAAGGGALTGLTSRLRGFLLVFGVIHFCQFANRLWNVLVPGHPSYLLYLIQSALGPLQGLGNAVMYGWSPLTRRVWSNACPTLCACVAPEDVDVVAVSGSTSAEHGGRVREEIAPPLEEDDDGPGARVMADRL